MDIEAQYLTGITAVFASQPPKIKASQIWKELPTNDRTELFETYGREFMPTYLQKPTDEQIITVLSRAKDVGYLLTDFQEYKTQG